MRPSIAWAALFCCCIATVSFTGCRASAEEEFEARARSLQKNTPLIDGHNDFPWLVRQNARGDLALLDIATPKPALMTDIPRLRQGGVGGVFWSVYVPDEMTGPPAVQATLEQIDLVHRMMRTYPDTFELATKADDIERIFASGKIVSLIGMEGGHSIDNSLATLRMFYGLGARYMTLTHSTHVDWADSASEPPRLGGLSPFGEDVVREMNRLGMLVDLSHVSPETMDDALRVAAAPVIFSHSSARAIFDHERNVPDWILTRLPANGGIVMVTFVPNFLGLRRARLSDVADHMDHIRHLIGADHIGIGSDFDGMPRTPIGLPDVSAFPALTAELLRRGWQDDEVRKVLGLNVIRVLRRAEEVAARLQRERMPSIATIQALDPPLPKIQPEPDGQPATPEPHTRKPRAPRRGRGARQ